MYLLIKIFEITDVPCFWISYIGTRRGIWVWYTKSLSIKPKSSRPHNIIKTSCCAIIPIRSVVIIISLIIHVHVLLRRFSIVLNVHLMLLFLYLLLINLIWENDTINLRNMWVTLSHPVGNLVLLPSLNPKSVNHWPLGLSTRCSACFSGDSRLHGGNFLSSLRQHILLCVWITYTSASSLIQEGVFLFLIYWVGIRRGVTSSLRNIWEEVGLLKNRITNIGIKRWFLCR